MAIDIAVVGITWLAAWNPGRWPGLALCALALIPLVWLATFRYRRWLSGRTGLEEPLVFVLLATCVATVPIVDWRLGAPKVMGMAVGAALVVAIGNAVRARQHLRWAITAASGLAFLIAGAGLTGTSWIRSKAPLLEAVYDRLPLALQGIVPHGEQRTIHPNELAGVLLLVAPVLLAQAGVSASRAESRIWAGVRSALAAAAGVVALGVVVLTQSRSGLAGMGVALALLGGVFTWRVVSRRKTQLGVRGAVAGVYALTLGAIVWQGWRMLRRWVSAGSGAGSIDTFEGRLEVWDRAWWMIQDFAFTGIGLGQYSPVLHALYVPLLISPGEYVPHAHNLYLQYAAELGIPGAVAFGCLVVAFFRCCIRAVISPDPLLRWTGAGLALGMVGFMVYGLTDAIAPGARGGIVLWLVLGLGGAVGNVARNSACEAKHQVRIPTVRAQTS